MVKLFWLIFALVAVLCFENGRYAVKTYISNRQYLLFTLYLVLLVTFGYIVLNLTTHVFSAIQVIQENNLQMQ